MNAVYVQNGLVMRMKMNRDGPLVQKSTRSGLIRMYTGPASGSFQQGGSQTLKKAKRRLETKEKITRRNPEGEPQREEEEEGEEWYEKQHNIQGRE
eukprot:gene11968-8241_t